MKNLLLILSIFLGSWLTAQHYYVVKVDGKIFDGGTALTPKYKLSEEAELRFSNLEAKATVLSPKRGYFVLAANDKAHKKGSEFFLAVKQALIPPSQLKVTAIRANIDTSLALTLEHPYDLLDVFRGTIAYRDSLILKLDTEGFADKGTFHLTVRDETERHNYQLQATNGYLVLKIPSSHNLTTASFQLSYEPFFSEEEVEPESFNLLPLDKAQLHAELLYLHSLLPDHSPGDFVAKIALPHCELNYGKISPGYLLALIKE